MEPKSNLREETFQNLIIPDINIVNFKAILTEDISYTTARSYMCKASRCHGIDCNNCINYTKNEHMFKKWIGWKRRQLACLI